MDEHMKFIDTETKIIEISKWLAGEKMGRDPGDPYILDLIEKHGAEIRDAWNKSKCKNCKKNCRHNLKLFCEEFFPEEINENPSP
jgi:hypothetical protein